jgi:hypothetical protein
MKGQYQQLEQYINNAKMRTPLFGFPPISFDREDDDDYEETKSEVGMNE